MSVGYGDHGLSVNGVDEVRDEFAVLLNAGQFVTDKSGVKTIEIVGASFVADEETILGEVNRDYVEREIAWYESQSLSVYDIPGGAPEIWKQCASKDDGAIASGGFVNSNYGFLLHSDENCNQFDHVVAELRKNPLSRRAVAIYTRPQMWYDYCACGMSDFVCTNAVQYLYRGEQLDAVVQMRSNDAWAGYRNDRAWQRHALQKVAKELFVEPGDITWQAGSLHFYERQFYLVDHYWKTGETHVSRKDYAEMYPESPWR